MPPVSSFPMTYDPNKVTQALGPIIPTGFAKDKKVSIRKLEEGFTLHIGCDGTATRSINRNASGEIKIHLATSSPTNDLLSAQHNMDLATGLGVLPYAMADLNGTTLVEAAGAWITKMPDFEKAKETGEVEWVLQTGKLEVHVGGNYL